MGNFIKKVLAITGTMFLIAVCSMQTVKANGVWESYFGATDDGWYEGAEGRLTKNSETSWTAQMVSIGWGGCWGAQVYQNKKLDFGDITIHKGLEYVLSFDMSSSTCDKLVYVKVCNNESVAFSDWIRLKKGENYKYYKSFEAKEDADSIYFGIGGEFGDRSGVDTDVYNVDAEYRYNVFYSKFGFPITNYTDVDPTFSTSIKCDNFRISSLLEDGQVGDWSTNIKYQYNNGELMINGTGRIDKYIESSNVQKLTVNDGITCIGENTFEGYSNLKEVVLAQSVNEVKSNAFKDCNSIEKFVVYGKNCAFIGSGIPKKAVIYGYKNSTAETYARLYGQEFVAIDEENVKPSTSPIDNKSGNATLVNSSIKQVSSFKAVNRKGKKVKLTWKKVSGAKGYEINYAENKKFTKNTNLKQIKKVGVKSYTIKKLKKKKTYYFRIRAYKVVNGKKIYSGWSSTKKLKIKK